ncbi:acyltransferase family protein [Sphingomonas sp. Xoc002]|uniref:acyltransferase family protein n=1 Tax=Sphingomonas sp. Xoc002 TaxID=2837624 RepID=UPI003D1858C3
MQFAYRRDVDGLRAIAIVSVVLFHYGISLFANGFLGVDIFFVISGYLITSIIYREMIRGEFTYAKFYSRRFRRILPALIAAVAVTTVVAWSLLPPYDLKRYAITAIGALSGLSNFAFFSFVDYFSPKADRQLLLMTWSLGVEEQFYILFPPAMAFLIGWRKKLLLPIMAGITIASLLLAIVANHYRPEAAFYLIPFRAWELGVGALLAQAGANGIGQSLSRRVQEGLAAGAILLFVLAIGIGSGFPIIAERHGRHRRGHADPVARLVGQSSHPFVSALRRRGSDLLFLVSLALAARCGHACPGN